MFLVVSGVVERWRGRQRVLVDRDLRRMLESRLLVLFVVYGPRLTDELH